jgi:hypothetical protein
MPHRILAAIRSQPWAILPDYLEAIEGIALRLAQNPALDLIAEDGHADRHFEALAQMGARAEGTRAATLRDSVGCLPIMGPILPRAALVSPSGAGACALDHAAADLRALNANKDVRNICIVMEKPVTVHVTGQGCSAGYWIASQATGGISLDPTGIVGSIGVAMSTRIQEGPDQSGHRVLDITSSNAPNKRPDLTTDEGRATLRAMLDQVEGVFIADVARGRGVTAAAVKSDFGAGGLKTGSQAKDAGMVDRVEVNGLDATLSRLARGRAPATPRRTVAALTLDVAHIRARQH